MVAIELRPLPGVGAGQRRCAHRATTSRSRRSSARSRADRAALRARAAQPVAAGHARRRAPAALARRRGSDVVPGVAFATAEPFRVAGPRLPREAVPGDAGGHALRARAGARLRRRQRARSIVEFSATPKVARAGRGAQPRALHARGARPRLRPRRAARSRSRATSPGTRSTRSSLGPGAARGPARAARWSSPTAARSSSTSRDGRPTCAGAPGQGIVERFGPQMVPVDGRGEERLDLRIHQIDPLDRSFWPFPDRPVSVDERQRPPGPGEEPPAARRPARAT